MVQCSRLDSCVMHSTLLWMITRRNPFIPIISLNSLRSTWIGCNVYWLRDVVVYIWLMVLWNSQHPASHNTSQSINVLVVNTVGKYIVDSFPLHCYELAQTFRPRPNCGQERDGCRVCWVSHYVCIYMSLLSLPLTVVLGVTIVVYILSLKVTVSVQFNLVR